MNQLQILSSISFILCAFLVVGCQQPGQITGDAVLASAKDPNDNLDDQDAVVDDDGEEVPVVAADEEDRKACRGFMVADLKINLAAQNDEIVSGAGHGNLDSGRKVKVVGVAGILTVMSALEISIKAVAGKSMINALDVTEAKAMAGNMCIRAKHIGKYEAAAGRSYLIADTIDEIHVAAGRMHIYKAQVKSAKAFAGIICLHDGAKILDQSQIAGKISETCKDKL